MGNYFSKNKKLSTIKFELEKEMLKSLDVLTHLGCLSTNMIYYFIENDMDYFWNIYCEKVSYFRPNPNPRII